MEVQRHIHSLDAGDLEAASPISRIAEDRQEIHHMENCSVFGGGVRCNLLSVQNFRFTVKGN
jgi:hypothetical protein